MFNSKKSSECSREHALVVGSVRFNDLVLLFLGELHGLEHHANQVVLHGDVVGHEVRHQHILDVLSIHVVLQLVSQLFGCLCVFRLQRVVFRLQMVQLLHQRLHSVLQLTLLVLRNLLFFDQLVTSRLPLTLVPTQGLIQFAPLLY